MAKHNTSQGFTVVEALLILVIVGILGFTGWYVYHARQVSDQDYSSSASAQTIPPPNLNSPSAVALKVGNVVLTGKTYPSISAQLASLHKEGYITDAIMADQPTESAVLSIIPDDYIYACVMYLDFDSFAVGDSTISGNTAGVTLLPPANSKDSKYSGIGHPKVTLVYQNGKWAVSNWTCVSN